MSGIERLGIMALGGDDNVVLCGLSIGATVDLAEGNDVVNAARVRRADVTLLGGPGEDVLIGGAGNDRIEGGPGNDYLRGGS